MCSMLLSKAEAVDKGVLGNSGKQLGHCKCMSSILVNLFIISPPRPVASFRHGVLFCENECYIQLNGCGLHIHNINSCV